MEDTTKLNESKLGTKKYWDDFYSVERNNFKGNPEDTGECWFDDNGAEERMVDFIIENLNEYDNKDSSVIDLGTGNGHLLFELYENDFAANMLGVDYSTESIQFATDIAKNKGYPVKFTQADVFDSSWNPGEFDIVADKGTLDAIALSGLTVGEKNQPVIEVYHSVIEKILKKNGTFLITSCNFTEEELIKIITKGQLTVLETIEYPVFEFGGVKGSTICSVAFVKK
ncbi:similar to Saccharomyces cerevisiae YIL064W SEE1 Probable lysine methyltransferase involved in the dimethylation of eEF1A (Tef1p/Tef2p) [Maudiozyma barnettii]|uniref:Protein-lysine N-methyltransferase EFM4 n=1 Tax=Maudiozyma barnettii TaxID=61262 RepID=A0A8H2ZFD6_9SACH|nr:uncharacterized protein KABA2_01S09240 [Kazachstania barnettii]CAB4252244.1 similar to Saccharomyces cerevisiae YIL064W SEE1 Probable lysine methyltransferase involved in the dimethylation of eEF1A (Tef1p/Tef2p) [Kazachstania barnettii]CAD1778907.1 similar to Saccharomyces cerevisiae YIL064W SEE1 Probable lysine methyltransferase involved in the dimethylation of eEF1A (Tef1p/Tef2p) [Kazachstania barnettii]